MTLQILNREAATFNLGLLCHFVPISMRNISFCLVQKSAINGFYSFVVHLLPDIKRHQFLRNSLSLRFISTLILHLCKFIITDDTLLIVMNDTGHFLLLLQDCSRKIKFMLSESLSMRNLRIGLMSIKESGRESVKIFMNIYFKIFSYSL